MPTDLIIELAPDLGNQLRLRVIAEPSGNLGLPAAGLILQRPLIAIDAQEAAALRRGDAPAPLVLTVFKQVNEWLLGNDLRQIVNTALAQANGNGPVRLIFSLDARLLGPLADVPFELLDAAFSPLTPAAIPLSPPLVLSPKVSAFVHLLPKVGVPAGGPPASWPLRILVVRSNPVDLGGAVPAAAPLVQYISNLHPSSDPATAGLVEIDFMSREPEANAGLPRWETFREQLLPLKRGRGHYHVLVFLGHGDLGETFVGLEPMGALMFESEDGQVHEPIDALRFGVELQNHPVPVVLLAGCLTAAELPVGFEAAIGEELPRWMRGNQGVAQALVNGASGVQIAVGMRYKLETNDALRFLKEFFRSLLGAVDAPNAGDVEAAIRHGRAALFGAGVFPPSWSAPLLFRAPGAEPIFPFLRELPDALPSPEDQRDQEMRETLWGGLVKLPVRSRSPELLQPLTDLLDGAERRLLVRALGGNENVLPAPVGGANSTRSSLSSGLAGVPVDAGALAGGLRGAVVMPVRTEAPPDQEEVEVPVRLFGNLPVSRLRGRLTVSGGAEIRGIVKSDAIKQRSYSLLTEIDGSHAGFDLQWDAPDGGPANAQPPGLPDGLLFTIRVAPGAAVPAVYHISIERAASTPKTILRPLSNALLAPPP